MSVLGLPSRGHTPRVVYIPKEVYLPCYLLEGVSSWGRCARHTHLFGRELEPGISTCWKGHLARHTHPQKGPWTRHTHPIWKGIHPLCGQIHACKNITFPQLRWWVAKILNCLLITAISAYASAEVPVSSNVEHLYFPASCELARSTTSR